MAIKSVYCPDPKIHDGVLVVAGDEHRHLKVSRTDVGENVEVFDGGGRVWTGEVASSGRNETHVRIVAERRVPPPDREIVLAQALIKNAAFEWILEKAVEVGVTRIVPFRTDRSNNTGPGREKRWRRIVVEAAKQSKHYHLPRLDAVTELRHVFKMDARSKILFAEQSGGSLESAISGSPVLYFIGPEGGWTAGERETARVHGVQEVRLGSHIMRAETAAIVAGALIAHQLGGL